MIRTAALLLALLGSAAALAAPVASGAPADAKRDELNDLRGRLDALKRDLAKSEESKASAADQLRDIESAISDANRRLRELTTQRGAVQDEIAALDTQSKEISARSAAQQQMLGRLLRHQFAHGEADALRLLLAGEDPNQNARDRHFLTLLSQTRAEIIGKLREAQVEKQRLAETAKERQVELEKIEAKQKEQRESLVAQQKQRQAVLAKISDRIRGQRKELGALKRDEQRLSNLIAQLAKIASRPKKPKVQKPAPSGRNESPRLHNEKVPQPGSDGSDFAALKGRLRLPVKGEIANRFGTPRAEGGATWKGLFIRAGEGSEVRAVAAGRVVFSDWLRGFGNLLIVDHDDGYLSVYGNNQSLYRQPGDAVKAGEAIAAAGNSGGNAESGLYFELRFQGQAFDPLKWVSLR